MFPMTVFFQVIQSDHIQHLFLLHPVVVVFSYSLGGISETEIDALHIFDRIDGVYRSIFRIL